MSDKLDFLRQPAAGPAERLRQHLTALENRNPTLLQQNRPAVLAYLAQMDDAWRLLQQLASPGGPDLTAERLRFDALQRKLTRQAPRLLTIFGGAATLKSLRPAGALPNERPWWFVDRQAARQRANTARRLAIGVGVAAAVVAAAVILFNTFLKPDPQVILAARHYDRALALAQNPQNYPAALLEVDQALRAAPRDADLLVFKGVLLDQLGRSTEAAALFEQASALAGTPEDVLLGRGEILRQLNQPQQALALARAAIAANPQSAEGWFLAGQIYADLGQIPPARDAFSRAAELALEQGNGPLHALAKANLGYLPLNPPPEATP